MAELDLFIKVAKLVYNVGSKVKTVYDNVQERSELLQQQREMALQKFEGKTDDELNDMISGDEAHLTSDFDKRAAQFLLNRRNSMKDSKS